MVCFFDENEQSKCFSNWYRSPFVYVGRSFFSVEQFMLYHKVLLFRKTGLAKKIRGIKIPVEVKTIPGYPFSEFDSEVWNKISYNIVKRGVEAKFRNNIGLQEKLLSTGNELIAACSPTDRKWGIGTGIDDPKKEDVNRWKGSNCLGRILMEVREEIMQERVAAAAGFDLKYCLRDEEPIPEWKMTAGELKRIPQFYRAIHTYSDTLCGMHEKKVFYGGKLSGWDYSMQWNMGGGLPIIGFYEMKQEVYDIAARLNNLKLALHATGNTGGKPVL
jgi:ribA/ribD-fused uncharacterized protein